MRKILLLVVFVLALSIGMNSVTTSAAIADGTYNLNYQVNEFGTNSASIANDYFLKPAKLIVSNGNMKVQVTIKKSSWVTEFKPPGGGTVVSTNASTNQRVVQFNVANFNSITVGMKVDIEEGDLSYHHTYNTDFMFFEGSLKLVQAAPKPVEKPNTSEVKGNNQSSNNQQSTIPQNGESGSSKEVSQDNGSSSNTQSNASSSSSDTQTETSSSNSSSEASDEESEQIEEQEPNPDTADTFPYIYVLLLIGSIMLLVINKKYSKKLN